MDFSYICAYSRTPIGSYNGQLKNITAPNLAAATIKTLLKQTPFKTGEINEVIMGNVLSAGVGQAPSRQASIYAGLPYKVECMTINKVCGSGLKAIMLADQAIKLNDIFNQEFQSFVDDGAVDEIHKKRLREEPKLSSLFTFTANRQT